MDKAIDNSYSKFDQYQAKDLDELSRFIDKLNLPLISNSQHIEDIAVDQVSNEHIDNSGFSQIEAVASDPISIANKINDLFDSFGKGLISEKEFIQLMEQTKKDKAVIEEICRKDRIKHRVEDFQGMLNVFNNGSQAFLATKVAISQLISML